MCVRADSMNGTQSEPTFDRGGANVQELLASFPQGEPGDEEEEEEEEDYEIGAQEDRNGEDDGTEVYAISEGERSQPRHSLINSADFSSISNQQGQEAEPQMTTEESSASLTGTATGTGEKVSSSSDDRERAAEREGAREAMRVDTTSTELAIATLTSGKRINFSGAFLQAHVAAITHTRQAGPVLEALLVEPRMEEVRNTFWAYRVLDMETGQSFESSDDDGEPGAGEKVLLTMQRLCLDNLLLIVTQWDTGAQGRLGSRLFRQVVGVCKSLLSDLQKEIVGEGKGTRGSRGGKGRDGFPQRSGDGSGMLAVVAERTTFQDSYVLQTSAMEGGGMGSLSYMQGPDGGSLSLPKASMESEGAGVPLKFPGAGGRGVGTASNKALIHQAAVSVMHRDMTRELLNQRGGNALKKPEALSGPRKAPAPVRPHLLSRKANRGASPENVEGGRGRKKKRPPAKGQKGSGGGFGPKCQFTSFDFDEINEPMEIPPKFGAAQGSSALQGGPLGPNNFMSAAVAAQDPSRALNERTKVVFCVGVLLGIVPPDSGSQSQW
uniref:Impact N-terminal domain-containing protein n=1 Tax=Chromera velia CCMP2878 TaxID=1169474 RepID=A0A0G4HVJ8_9ALVE|eukprot:Cvel_32268.t1-p1 / transcript=Cvel_32268.t1 / gene=Cvel_32268 / organism=Chromera_velia_CCMP2878 / gene_product=Protein IMPACT homolog, putative / transcript_product=Protein IMPACT homolog, putative / location=Cvel_scaffold4978:1423-6269(+) / protein_length=550 / sequence_SO=supercontig / SO=protein_coding / is_pseudo=false